MFDDTLGQAVVDADNVVLGGALLGLLQDPRDVGGIVAVDGRVLAPERVLLSPQQHPDPLDAVLGQPRGVGDGAEGKVDLDILKQLHLGSRF